MAEPTKEAWDRARGVLSSWASTTAANNLRKMIARQIDEACAEAYMAGYEAGKKSAQFDQAAE